jgi:hypothetical protein
MLQGSKLGREPLHLLNDLASFYPVNLAQFLTGDDIHGGKTKNSKIEVYKIAALLRGELRIVTKNQKTGNMEILTAGTEQAKGLANNAEDAAEQGLEELAERLTPAILDKVAKYIQGNARKVALKVNGVPDLDTNMDIRETLQSIVWVSDVEVKRLGEFVVSYPENPVYLANSIRQKGRFTVVNFSPYSITLDYH